MNRNARLTGALVITVIALALVLVAIFAIQPSDDETAEGTEEAEDLPGPLYPDIEFDEVVTAFRVTDSETGQTVAASLSGEGEDATWAIEEAREGTDTGLGVDQESIQFDVASLTTITPSRVLSEIESLGTYGLEESRYAIEFTTSGGRTYSMSVGSQNPGGSAYYVRIPDSESVYLIPTYSIDPLVGYLETPPFIQPTPDPNVTPSATPADSSG
jgi:hypothetical protein